jgi:hypothetical protein
MPPHLTVFNVPVGFHLESGSNGRVRLYLPFSFYCQEVAILRRRKEKSGFV